MQTDSIQTESLGKLLPRVLLPYAQQWAERSGMAFLSRLLVDEHLRALIERYADELFERLSHAQHAPPKETGRVNGNKPALRVVANDGDPAEDATDLSDMDNRLKAIEAQYELLLGVLETVRAKMRPLAASLGCCPECLVGVAGCPKCLGQSKVGHYEPDTSLLRAEVVTPLAARGVPLTLKETALRRARPASEGPSATRPRSTQWPKK